MAWSDFYMDTATGSNLNSGSGSTSTTIYTSTSGNWDGTSVFTPTDGSTPASTVTVGDWCSVYPTGNTTTPYVAQVTVIGAGVNGTITLSTTAKFGTAPTSNSGSRNLIDGGNWKDLGMMVAGVALATGTVTQSTRINVKAGTYANAATTRTFALTGTATAPVWWRGYKTTPGDQDSNSAAVEGTDIPSWTFTTGAATLSASHHIFASIGITSSSTGTSVSMTGVGLTWYHMRITNTSTGNCLSMVNSSAVFERCYFQAGTAGAFCVSVTSNNSVWDGCYWKSGVIGMRIGAGTMPIVRSCIFDSQQGDAINFNGAAIATVIGCSFYAPLGNGINIANITNPITVINNYFENVSQSSKAAINNTSGTNTDAIRAIGNAYFNCTATVLGLGDFPLIFDNGTLASAGFVAPASQNFAINTVGQGIAEPGTFETFSNFQGYLDIGAVQHQGSGSSGGAILSRVFTGQ